MNIRTYINSKNKEFQFERRLRMISKYVKTAAVATAAVATVLSSQTIDAYALEGTGARGVVSDPHDADRDRGGYQIQEPGTETPQAQMYNNWCGNVMRGHEPTNPNSVARIHGTPAIPTDENIWWLLEGTAFSANNRDIQFSQNEDGSYNLVMGEDDAVYLPVAFDRTAFFEDDYMWDGTSYSRSGDFEGHFGITHLNQVRCVEIAPFRGINGGDTATYTLGYQKMANATDALLYGIVDTPMGGNAITIHVTVTTHEYFEDAQENGWIYGEPYLRKESGYAEKFLNVINERRAFSWGACYYTEEAKPLVYNPELQDLADRRAMEVKDNYVHTHIEGYGDYAELFGVAAVGSRANGEAEVLENAYQFAQMGNRDDLANPAYTEMAASTVVLGTVEITVLILR